MCTQVYSEELEDRATVQWWAGDLSMVSDDEATSTVGSGALGRQRGRSGTSHGRVAREMILLERRNNHRRKTSHCCWYVYCNGERGR